jgi:hypothetical protein
MGNVKEELHNKLIKKYSYQENYKKAREECNELANAITDFLSNRTEENINNMIYEAVDVYTMCERIFIYNVVPKKTVKKLQVEKMEKA